MTASASTVAPAVSERWSIVIVFVVLFALCVLGIDRDLWTPDEPREAEISREMSLSPGIVPTLNDVAFIEKPPLYYWTVAAVYRLVGGPSAMAARSVSVAASFLTLLVVFLWGQREFSTTAGLAAATGLATSTQFMISSHWVLIDPLLMLSTTIAAWAAWDLIRGQGGAGRPIRFYVALALALWIKGLIGPVLIACGLIAYAGLSRSVQPVLSLRPIVGGLSMLAATAVLALLIYAEAGQSAVREWLWVNHVQRFIDPEYTGHEQPFYYYLSALPIAVFPWWVPFADIFRPGRWRSDNDPWSPMKIYLGAMCLGMFLVLSASATKRGIYLLPMLPLLFLLLAAHATQWWCSRSEPPTRSRAWWTQILLITCLAGAPPLVGLIYLRVLDTPAIAFLVMLAVLVVVLVVVSRRANRQASGALLGALSACGVVGLMGITAHLGAPKKNMTPIVEWIDGQIPANEPVYVVGNVDETVLGIVPFVTGRRVVELGMDQLSVVKPATVLVQDKGGGSTAPEMPGQYEFVREQLFGRRREGLGDGRYFAIWRRQEDN